MVLIMVDKLQVRCHLRGCLLGDRVVGNKDINNLVSKVEADLSFSKPISLLSWEYS